MTEQSGIRVDKSFSFCTARTEFRPSTSRSRDLTSLTNPLRIYRGKISSFNLTKIRSILDLRILLLPIIRRDLLIGRPMRNCSKINRVTIFSMRNSESSKGPRINSERSSLQGAILEFFLSISRGFCPGLRIRRIPQKSAI